jgi:hypothetical protein
MSEFVEEWCRHMIKTVDVYTGASMWYKVLLHYEFLDVRWVERLDLFSENEERQN